MKDGAWKGLFGVCGLLFAFLIAVTVVGDQDEATTIVVQLAAVNLLVAMGILMVLIYIDWNPLEEIFERDEGGDLIEESDRD